MTNIDNPNAQKAIRLLAKSRIPDIFPAIWEAIHRLTDGQFTRLNEYLRAELAGEASEKREAIIRIIIQALESGDVSLLEPEPSTFAPIPASARV